MFLATPKAFIFSAPFPSYCLVAMVFRSSPLDEHGALHGPNPRICTVYLADHEPLRWREDLLVHHQGPLAGV
jgi:hypothetical protein